MEKIMNTDVITIDEMKKRFNPATDVIETFESDHSLQLYTTNKKIASKFGFNLIKSIDALDNDSVISWTLVDIDDVV